MKSLKYGLLALIMISASLCAMLIENEKELTQDERDFLKAAFLDNVEKMKFYLKKGVDINAQEDYSALMNAVSNGSLNATSFLLDHGADIDAQDSISKTALTLAVVHAMDQNLRNKNSLATIKILLANNASYEIKNAFGDTALSNAQSDIKIKSIFDEIIEYKNAVEKDKKIDALVTAITHNNKNDSQFTKEEWIRFSLWNKYDKQLLYALDKKVIALDDVLRLIAKVYNIPLSLIPKLMDSGKINFKDLKPYYEMAKKEDNKKFGRYYVELQKIVGKPKKSQQFPEEIIKNISTFLETEPVKKEIKPKQNKKFDIDRADVD